MNNNKTEEEKRVTKKELRGLLNLAPEYVTTRYGIKVRKACVSCQYGRRDGVDPDTGEAWTDMCPVRAKIFKTTYKPLIEEHPVEDKLHKCERWKMCKGLEKAGKGGGKVRLKSAIIANVKKMEEERERRKEQIFQKRYEMLKNTCTMDASTDASEI